MYYYVYVLWSDKAKEFYIGYTTEVLKRYRAHQAGRVESTKHKKPWQLVYYEAYLDKADAKGRELFLKSGSGKRYLKKQLSNFFTKAKINFPPRARAVMKS